MRLFFLLACFFVLNTTKNYSQKKGKASYYHSKFEGRKTASGEIFSNQLMTAASNYYKLGQKLKVTNPLNGKTIIVTINDRMAPNSNRIIDLTRKGAELLSFLEKGICDVIIENIILNADSTIYKIEDSLSKF